MPRHAVRTPLAKPTMEVKLNGLPLNIGPPTANWPGTLREIAKAVASAAVERALEFGERNSATIEIWDKDGKLLVAMSASIQARWCRHEAWHESQAEAGAAGRRGTPAA